MCVCVCVCVWKKVNERKIYLVLFMIYLLFFLNLLRTFCPHLGSFCVVSSFTTFRPNFTSGLLQLIYRDLG